MGGMEGERKRVSEMTIPSEVGPKGESSQSVCKCEEIILVVLVHQKGERWKSRVHLI